MEIILNGEPHQAPENASLQTLVESVGMDPSRVAIELDGTIVRRSEWPMTFVKVGSCVELVQFVGGGR